MRRVTSRDCAMAPPARSGPAGSGEGGGQQGEGGDDDGDTDVVVAVPAVHLLLPVLGAVLDGPRLAPVVDRDEQQERHYHAHDQQRGGNDDEDGARGAPSGG